MTGGSVSLPLKKNSIEKGMCDLWLTFLVAGCRVPKDLEMSSCSLRLDWATFLLFILFMTVAVITVLQLQSESDYCSPQFFLKWRNYNEICAPWYSVYSPAPYSWRHWQQSYDIYCRDLPLVGSPQNWQHVRSLGRVLDLQQSEIFLLRYGGLIDEWYVYQSGA